MVPFQLSAKVASAPALLTYWPTEVQAEDEEQETSARELLVAPAGFGVLWSVQPSPLTYNCCIAEVPLSPLFPTAVHAVEVQDTLNQFPAGLTSRYQLLPFQPSTSVSWSERQGSCRQSQWGKVAMQYVPAICPTTVHWLALVHETPKGSRPTMSHLPAGGGGSASVCADQLVPFQRSTHPPPTAVHAAAAEQDTRENMPGIGPATASCDHALPFQDSESGVCVPVLST